MTLILEDNEILTVDGMVCQGCESRIERNRKFNCTKLSF